MSHCATSPNITEKNDKATPLHTPTSLWAAVGGNVHVTLWAPTPAQVEPRVSMHVHNHNLQLALHCADTNLARGHIRAKHADTNHTTQPNTHIHQTSTENHTIYHIPHSTPPQPPDRTAFFTHTHITPHRIHHLATHNVMSLRNTSCQNTSHQNTTKHNNRHHHTTLFTITCVRAWFPSGTHSSSSPEKPRRNKL